MTHRKTPQQDRAARATQNYATGVIWLVRDLTVQQRGEQVDRWVELEIKQQERDGRPLQIATATLSDGRKAPPQNQEHGVRMAARDTEPRIH